jgi:hypothetical protein
MTVLLIILIVGAALVLLVAALQWSDSMGFFGFFWFIHVAGEIVKVAGLLSG